jgi:two-component system sensor histidine kinase RpfC
MIGEMSAPMLSAWLEAGLDGCIGKPVEPTELIEAVNSCLPGAAARQLPSTARPSLVEAPQNPAIDRRVLSDLEKLGGPGFVDDIIAQFAADASRLLPELSASAAAGDAALFHDQLHALRSCAGNVGAVGLYKLCLASHAMPAHRLVNENSDYVAQLASEFDRAIAGLNQHEWRMAAPLLQQAS